MFDTSLSALTAAGGNSRAARSMRARLQWRDRFGRWIEMGRGVKFKVRGADGAPRSVIGSFVGAKSNTVGQVYVHKDPNGLPDGFYDVDSANAQEFVANLDEAQLAARGIELGKDANGQAVGERASEVIPNINQMNASPAPEGWEAIPGTFGGKKVIQTDDGDFRVHFGGKDETVLLEDHRAAPGQAEPQRSVAEAFKKVGDVDIQREDSGDQAYSGLGSEEENSAALANRDRDSKIEQIKGNERTLANEKAPLGAKQTAMTANETLKKELADAGTPYDPEGNDSDEALAARKAAPATDAAPAATAGTGDIDLSTFEVAPEGFLIPTGKQTNDITPEGLANFMTAEKEHLGKGGARLVVDTDNNTAEIYNSADTVDDAKAQAGGLGQDTVLDLSTGKPVQVSDGAVDPNSADVNPNLEGKTTDAPTGGAPNAEDRNSDAVESEPANPGADDAARSEPRGEDAGPAADAAPAADPSSIGTRDATGPSDTGREDGGDPTADDEPAEPDIEDLRVKRQGQVALKDLKVGDRFYDKNGELVEVTEISGNPDGKRAVIQNEDGTPRSGRNSLNSTVDAESGYSTDKRRLKEYDAGSIEELLERRAKAQAALDNAGDPKDIVALNDQIDALDNRIDAKSGSPLDENGKRIPDEEGLVHEPEDVRDWTDIELEDYNADAGVRGERNSDKLDRVREEIQRRRAEEAPAEEAPEVAEPAPERLPMDVESRQKQIGDLTDEELIAEINRMDQAGDIAEENNSSTDQIDAHLENLRTELNRRAAELDNPDDWTAPEELDDTSLESELEARAGLDWGNGARPDADETRIRELASEQARRANPEGAQRLREAQDAEEMELPENIEEASEDELYNILETNEKVSFRQLQKTDWDTVSRIKDRAQVIRSELSRRDVEAGKDPRYPFGKTTDGVDERGYTWGAEIRVNPNMRNNALDTRELLDRPAPEAPERPEYQEPGDADAARKARETLDAIDAEIEERLSAAEDEDDPQVQQEHLGRVRTLERQRKIQENALNRALGNEPMDFNGELGWNMRNRDNRGSLPEAPDAPTPTPTPEPEETPEPEADTPAVLDTSIADPRAAAQARLAQAEQDYEDVLKDPDYTEEQFEAAEQARADAQSALDELDNAPAEPESAPETPVAPVEAPEAAPEPVSVPEAPVEADTRSEARQVVDEINAREDNEAQIDPSETPGGLYEKGDDPYNVESGNQNKVDAIKAKMQGKDLTPEERADLEEALNSGVLSDNQVARISRAVDSKPNAANTGTVARPESEQPEYLSSADLDIVQSERDDPNFVFDEDLTWRKVREEYPNAVEQENGDLVLESVTNKGKKYDLMIRRTQQNRFMVYVMETDQQGLRRAKRISNSEWHSYEALENRITQGRKLINSKSPAGSLARRKDQPTESLGTQGFPADDFLGDIGNPEAPLPATGDDKFDRLLEVAAMHIRQGDLDIEGIEGQLQELDPGANAINTIMDAIIGRAQDNYRPSGINPWQTYDGELAEIGGEYDWTDWHQEKNWWLPNGRLNPDRKPNRNYGEVKRVRVMGYVKENSDGKGRTYGDHVWVSVRNDDGTWGNWVKRSAQTLRRAEPGSAPGLPFFSKREEWRSSPEALARRFRVPNAAADDTNVKTKPRPKGELSQSRRLRFTSRGTLAGYGNVPVPNSPAEIAGMIMSEQVVPSIAPANTARPGMLITRMDENGTHFVDSIIRVDNLGDGGYRIHAARPDGKGGADVDSFVVPGDADIALWTAPDLRAPAKPEPDNARQGEVVAIGDGSTRGVVLHDDGEGSLIVATPEGTVDVPAAEAKAPEAGQYPTVEFLQAELAKAEENRNRMRNDRDSFLSARANNSRIQTLQSMIELSENDWKTEAEVLVFDGKVASDEPRKGQYGMYYVLSDEAAAAYGKRFFNPSQARNARERDAAKGFTYEWVNVPVTVTPSGDDYTINTRGLVGQDISVLRDTEVQTGAPSSESRSDLLSVTDELNIPQSLRDLLRRWAMDPNVSEADLDGIMAIMRNFNTMSPIERLIDMILDRMGVPNQVRSSILNNN